MRDDGGTIGAVRMNGDNLEIEVSYAGGCEDHVFDLSWSGTYLKSHPAQVVLDLRHNAHGDMCEAYITETVVIDVSELKQGDSGHLVLRVDDQASVHYKW